MTSTTTKGVSNARKVGASAAISAALALSGATASVQAQERYIGEIFMAGFNFCPRSTTSANGQLLAISSNDALFSLFGTIYGGDGRTTFALPDLRGRVPMHMGTGPGLSPKSIGQKTGTETNTLTVGQMPSHSHALTASSNTASATAPAGNSLANGGRTRLYGAGSDASMAAASIGNTGGNQAQNNMQPSLVINYCVVLQGIYPSRN